MRPAWRLTRFRCFPPLRQTVAKHAQGICKVLLGNTDTLQAFVRDSFTGAEQRVQRHHPAQCSVGGFLHEESHFSARISVQARGHGGKVH